MTGIRIRPRTTLTRWRERVGAHRIAAEDVTIDYILDERLRELSFEEPRIMTLGRLGLIYDRVSRYNDYTEGEDRLRVQQPLPDSL